VGETTASLLRRSGGGVRWRWIAPLGLLAALLFVGLLSLFVALPGEHTVKGWFGVHYSTGGCGGVRDRGEPGHWRTERPLGEARDELRAVRMGNFAYIVGGAALPARKLTTVRTFERYDLRTGKRTSLPPLPVPLNHTGVATYRGDVYVVGGAGDDLERATNRFWRFSMRDQRWSALPPMPTARTALGAAVVGGRLYAIGGKDRRIARNAVEAYDFRAKRWTKVAPLRTRRDHLNVLAHAGMIYGAGGRNERRGVVRDFDRYDPRADRWTSLPDLPQEKSGSGLLDFGDRLVMPGGENPPRQYMTGSVDSYDLRTREWSKLPAMEHPRHGYASVAEGDRLFVFGGSRCAGQALPEGVVDSLEVGAG
jgi:serine/threonine-protein kinase PknK